MHEQHDSAIDAQSVKSGVTNDIRYETLSSDIHGFGSARARHDVLTCTDGLCGHSDHGLSTAGPNLEGNLRAGDVTTDAGDEAPTSRTYHPLNEYVGEFSIEEAVEPTYRETPGPIQLGDSVKNLMRASIQPDRRGGGSSGRKRNDGCSPDFGVTQGQIIRDILRYA